MKIAWIKTCKCKSISSIPKLSERKHLTGDKYTIELEIILPPVCEKCGKAWKQVKEIIMISKDEQIQILLNGLKNIKETAMKHPAFDQEIYEDRNIIELGNVGGDVWDWTILALDIDNIIRKAQVNE